MTYGQKLKWLWVQSRGQASPQTLGRRGPSAPLSLLSVRVPPSPLHSHLLPFLFLPSIESPHLSFPVGLAQPGCVWGEPCPRFGVTRPRWRLQSQRMCVQVQTLPWNSDKLPPLPEPQFSFLKNGNSERPTQQILNASL